jgi:SAM-dependent methyltransferase
VRPRRQREALFDPATIEVLSELGVGPGWRCLEVGAGEGSIAAWLVDRCGDGLVTTTDITDDYLSVARARLGERATVLRNDLEADPLPGGPFDLVHLRFVLEHVREKPKALAKLADALRPGGRLVLEYTDFTACAVAGGAYAGAMAAFADALPCVGAADRWGRALVGAVAEAGLVVTSAESRQRWFPGASVEATYWTTLWFDVRARVRSTHPDPKVIDRAVTEIADPTLWFPAPAILTITARRP